MKSSCHFLFNHLALPTLQNSTQFYKANSLSLSNSPTIGISWSEFSAELPVILEPQYITAERTAYKTSIIVDVFIVQLPSTGHDRYLLHIVVRVTQQRTVYQESVFAETCLSRRCLAMDLHVTIYCHV
jgi:hypothetical protein